MENLTNRVEEFYLLVNELVRPKTDHVTIEFPGDSTELPLEDVTLVFPVHGTSQTNTENSPYNSYI